MRVIADLHMHGRYSRATSQNMSVKELAHYAQIKGLNLIGTGDFTHPEWMEELKNTLTVVPETQLYRPVSLFESQVYFMVTSEVCTIFEFKEKTKKIHHVILTPSFEIAEQITDRLSKYGDMQSDGRPTLDMSAAELVEEVLNTSQQNVVFPAHAWTPWFSLFGAFSGFDRVEDCYQDRSRDIFALETGLSSDPPMNWRLSALDRVALVSNSDAHSPWPWRIGREANVFELEEVSYSEVIDAIREKDPKRFLFTIETNPAYGKYHWTGHRNCSFSVPPSEAIKLGNRCPVCKRKLTEGVEQRVEKLADRPSGFRPEAVIDYKHLLPLHEIIAATLGIDSLSSPTVWKIFNSLVSKFGNEFTVLLQPSLEALSTVVEPRIAEAIIRVREDRVKVEPGYDGIYGKLVFTEETREDEDAKSGQTGLERFI